MKKIRQEKRLLPHLKVQFCGFDLSGKKVQADVDFKILRFILGMPTKRLPF
jgi:hypothetical protein